MKEFKETEVMTDNDDGADDDGFPAKFPADVHNHNHHTNTNTNRHW